MSAPAPSAVRTLVVSCPDWPLVVAGLADRPSAAVVANRVVATSAAARSEGVRLGQRRREAQACCPELVVVPGDPLAEARAFEQVVAAVAEITPRVEVTRPGACAFPARAAARYFGGEGALVREVAGVAGAATVAVALAAGGRAPEPPCRVGIADGAFAARLAARAGAVVPRGATPSWLAGFPIGVLAMPSLADLLRRLGISTLGALAALDEGVVSARFGADGAAAHRLARGLDARPLALGEPPADLSVRIELDPPVERADALAFAAVGLAEELIARLAPRGLAATQLVVEAETEHGEALRRCWRGDRPFTARAMVERVRWQLEGWLEGPATEAPSAGVTLVGLAVTEAVPDEGRQLDLDGRATGASRQVERGLARVQGLLGHEAVLTGVRTGGRGPGEQVRLVPWGVSPEPAAGSPARGVRAPGRRRRTPVAEPPPWPGHLPPPSPALVYPVPLPAELLGPRGEAVGVTGRGRATAVPARVAIGGGAPLGVAGWSGPWRSDERWWDPAAARRRARVQVVLEDGTAHLLVLERGCWGVEATYD